MPLYGLICRQGSCPLCGGQRAGRPTHFPEPAAPRGVGDAALYRLPQKYLCKTKSDHLFLRWPLLFCLLQAFDHICHDLRRGLDVLGDAELLDNEHLIAALVGVVAHGA